MLLSLLLAVRSSVRSRVVRGLVYGPQPGHTVEVYAPVGADGEAPVVVVLCPEGDSPSWTRQVGQIFAARGLLAVVAGVGAPASALEDAAAACAWARDHVAAFGGDGERLFAFGRGEAAGLAARLAFEPRWLAEAGAAPLLGVVGFIGRYGVDGVEAAARARPDAPPLLLVTGQEQDAEASRLVSALRGVGAPVAEIRCPGFDPAPLHRLPRAVRLRLIALEEVERFIRLGSL